MEVNKDITSRGYVGNPASKIRDTLQLLKDERDHPV